VESTAPADPSRWPENCGDTCGHVFGQALRAAAPALKADARVLEIGCAEFDWLSRAAEAWPAMTFTGIDWRQPKGPVLPNVTRIKGDVMAQEFAPESFDWIVGVSSIEHIGLGHYQQDPKNEDGDSITMENAAHWLAPGGWLYLDVPWVPGKQKYHVHGTSHRVYDDEAIDNRLVVGGLTIRWLSLYGKNGHVVTEIHNLKGGESFYYRALWLQKG